MISKKCQFYPFVDGKRIKCENQATVRVKRTGTSYCDECYLSAILHMGCDLKGEKIENKSILDSQKGE